MAKVTLATRELTCKIIKTRNFPTKSMINFLLITTLVETLKYIPIRGKNGDPNTAGLIEEVQNLYCIANL
uniref:Uncharacterized protein n=1 Tax=Romanomermis culicivorax TaxID=13658 RepID=A0A915HLU1_ROMCU